MFYTQHGTEDMLETFQQQRLPDAGSAEKQTRFILAHFALAAQQLAMLATKPKLPVV